MADVDDRGQLLLVGALTLAVMLVALAVLLNAAIYTGNVATRDAGPEAGAVIEYENEATSMARDTINSLNERDDESYPHLRQNFTRTVENWSDMARAHSATSLSDASVETRSDPIEGTLIRQSTDRNFTSNSTAENWTVANDSTARAFQLNVSNDSLKEPPSDVDDLLFADDQPNYFRVQFNVSGGDEWDVYFARDANDSVTDDVTVSVRNNSGTVGNACSAPAESGKVLVNLTDARVGGEHCGALATLFQDIDAPYTVEYRNGQNGEGTYSLVVDRRIDQLETGADTSGDSQPSASPAIYSTDLELTYRTTDIYYQKNFTVAPGEADD